ncbi:MAG TPA: DNA translocase FtsK [Solirubrobacteraceae bacterium]|nr:DNA translocase FtsK [Solirubrobacteraceae bacterium]
MLDQRQLDVVGLALVALGVFLAGVLYLHWAPGEGGRAITRGLRFVVGETAYAVPVAFAGAGAIVILGPILPTTRPLRTGAICLFAASTLALAAGAFGLGPTGARHSFWQPAFMQARGGVVGEALYWGSARLFDEIGAQILAVFLALVGALLISGATVAGVLRATGSKLGWAGQRVHSATSEVTALLARRLDEHAAQRAARPELPPEPADAELIVRATHLEAPALDGASRYPGALDVEPDELEPIDALPDQPTDSHAVIASPDPPPRSSDPQPVSLTPQGNPRGGVTEADDFPWELPGSGLLTRSAPDNAKPDTAGQERTAAQLLEALGHFGVESKIVGTVAGPHITRYELRLSPGTKVSKVAQLKDDLAYALAATEIRILAPIPGKQAVGVEVPNARRRIVHLGDVFQDPPSDWSPLSVWLGKDVAGRAIATDLAKMPHLLLAGTTGAGKSGSLNAMLCAILLRATPRDVRFVLIDPKQVELNHYESIPHLLTPVITSPRMAANALSNLVREMEQRYAVMSEARTRHVLELNRMREAAGDPPLPYILCVIDELADLMMVAPADVEDAVIRLAQKARAVGIHLLLATQSPRVDVITGMIKANVPSRIAFAVSSQTDSRVILDQNGAESLLGQGDMLFSPLGSSRLQRIQGAYIDEAQVAKVTDFWRAQGEPELAEQLLEEPPSDGRGEGDDGFSPDEDPLLEDAIALVAQMQTASTSMLQRRLRLGYTRAGRLIDMLERRGIISGYEGSKPRQVLIGEGDTARVLAALASTGRVAVEVADGVSAEQVSEPHETADGPAH